MQNPLVRFENVDKSFEYWEDRPDNIKKILYDMLAGKFRRGKKHTIQVLQDVSFSIGPGEFVGVIGRNGVGKSTLLKMISGIYKPTRGSAECVGRIAPLLELGAGFAPELSGYDNIYLNASVLGFSKKETEEQIRAVIEFSELGDFIHMPVKKYSSGMLVRLGFSIAVHLDAPLFIFDEVMAFGDAWFQKKCLEKTKELHAKGKTILLVSHSHEEIKKYCKRVLVFSKHRLIYDGEAREGLSEYIEAEQNK